MKKYIVAALFFLSLGLSSSNLVSATNGDINPVGDNSCVDISINLSYKTTDALTGGKVSILQDFLGDKGFLSVQPTGYFGLMTKSAVKKFQASVGLSQTGYVGPLTRNKIKNTTCNNISVDDQKLNSPIITHYEIVEKNTNGFNPYGSGVTINLFGKNLADSTSVWIKHVFDADKDSGATNPIFVSNEKVTFKLHPMHLPMKLTDSVKVRILMKDGWYSSYTQLDLSSFMPESTTTSLSKVLNIAHKNPKFVNVSLAYLKNYKLETNLEKGSVGADVVALQSFLETKGFLTMAPGNAKGEFDEGTRLALSYYQEYKGIIPAEGSLGTLTRLNINQEISGQQESTFTNPVAQISATIPTLANQKPITSVTPLVTYLQPKPPQININITHVYDQAWYGQSWYAQRELRKVIFGGSFTSGYSGLETKPEFSESITWFYGDGSSEVKPIESNLITSYIAHEHIYTKPGIYNVYAIYKTTTMSTTSNTLVVKVE